MKLSEVIATWDRIHTGDTGELTFCGFCDGIEAAGLVIENDVVGGLRESAG